MHARMKECIVSPFNLGNDVNNDRAHIPPMTRLKSFLSYCLLDVVCCWLLFSHSCRDDADSMKNFQQKQNLKKHSGKYSNESMCCWDSSVLFRETFYLILMKSNSEIIMPKPMVVVGMHFSSCTFLTGIINIFIKSCIISSKGVIWN